MLLSSRGSWLTVLFLALLVPLFIAGSAPADDDDRDGKKSMTGVWVSSPPAWWVVRYDGGTFSGDVQMRWELEEDENGMITGFNIWHSPNPQEGPLAIGAMCMVGARNGSSVVISEAGLFNQTGPLVPSFEFECRHGGKNKARCLGNGFSVQPPVALTGNMKRLKNPEPQYEIEGFVIDDIRLRCGSGG
ncbi:MAG: hypothetical protein P8Q97_12440 [Myxococcota bacterium]|jgi:hypothetical protein|nr:hypothetical protein [Myxococcota bacterium]